MTGSLLQPVPWERIRLQRLLCTAYCVTLAVVRAPAHVRTGGYPKSAFRPLGIVAWVLREPMSQGLVLLIECACIGLGVLALVQSRRRTGAALPLFALALLWTSSYGQCFGMVLHTDNLAVLHVCVLALAQTVGWSGGAPGTGVTVSSWPLRALQWTTLASYFVAGIAKLRWSGLQWVVGDGLAQQLAYDTLRKIELGNQPSPLAEPLLNHSKLLRVFAALSLGLELGAPLCVLSGRLARWWCGGAWLFHASVVLVMAIVFPYPLSGVGLASFFPIEVACDRLKRRAARRRARRAAGRREPVQRRCL